MRTKTNSKKINPQPGDRYGEWTVIKEVESKRNNQGQVVRFIRCQCSCGKIKDVRLASLTKRNNPSRSCGHSIEFAFDMHRIHEYENNQRFYDQIVSFIKENDFDNQTDVNDFLIGLKDDIKSVNSKLGLKKLIDPETDSPIYLDESKDKIIDSDLTD